VFRRFHLRYSLVALCLLLIAPTLPAQRPGADCSKLVVNRTYVNSFSGLINVPVYFAAFGVQPPPGVGLEPNGGAGTVTFLDNGKFVNTETIAIGILGLSKDLSITGTYSLTWDGSKQPMACTGTMNGLGMLHGSSTPFTFQLIVSAGGQRVEMFHTDTGVIVGATTLPMSSHGCNRASLDAAYSYNAAGWILAPPGAVPPEQMLGGYIPFAMSGAMRFYPETPASVSDFPDSPKGARMVKAWDTPSHNGEIMPRTMTGWYQVNRDCTGTVVLRDSLGNPDFLLEMFIGADGQTVHFANVNDAVDLGNGISTPSIIAGFKLSRLDRESGMEHR
jgi:hypothetical protein